MGEVNKNIFIKIRDLITEMEPNLQYNENTILCCHRINKLMESVIFDNSISIVNGEIIHFKKDTEYCNKFK